MQVEYRCQICGKPATVHYMEIINGIKKETHYCGECAKTANSSIFADSFNSLYGTTNILSSIFGGKQIAGERLCECGMTERELLDGCKFGCVNCYKTFDDIAGRLVENIGGGVFVGDAPKLYKSEAKSHDKVLEQELSEIDKLLAELDIAIKEERYADCDKLKKKIDKLRADKK